MRNGNLSNKPGARVLIDVDTFMQNKAMNILDKVQATITGNPLIYYKVNYNRQLALFNIMRKSDCAISLVTTDYRLHWKNEERHLVLPCNIRYVRSKERLKDLLYMTCTYDYYITDEEVSEVWGTPPSYLKIYTFEEFLKIMGVK